MKNGQNLNGILPKAFLWLNYLLLIFLPSLSISGIFYLFSSVDEFSSSSNLIEN